MYTSRPGNRIYDDKEWRQLINGIIRLQRPDKRPFLYAWNRGNGLHDAGVHLHNISSQFVLVLLALDISYFSFSYIEWPLER